jgi:hypothetical protein
MEVPTLWDIAVVTVLGLSCVAFWLAYRLNSDEDPR